jgi:hypothetical protein
MDCRCQRRQRQLLKIDKLTGDTKLVGVTRTS